MEDNGKIIIEADETELGENKKDKKTLRVLSFKLGDENYCIDIKEIKEVVRISLITKVPNTPDFIAGIINLRGEILSVIKLGYFMGVGNKEITKESMVIVSDVKGPSIGVLADKISEAIDIEEEAVQPPLETVKKELASLTKGQVQIGSDIFVILDLSKILGCEEIEKLKKGE